MQRKRRGAKDQLPLSAPTSHPAMIPSTPHEGRNSRVWDEGQVLEEGGSDLRGGLRSSARDTASREGRRGGQRLGKLASPPKHGGPGLRRPQHNERGGEGSAACERAFALLIKHAQREIPIKTSRAPGSPEQPLFTSISWVPVQGQGGEGAGTSKSPRPTHCGRASTSHPSAGDCHPSNWSLRTARSGLHPQPGSDTAPKWGRFQQPLFPALRPPILKQHNRNSSEKFCGGMNNFPVAPYL